MKTKELAEKVNEMLLDKQNKRGAFGPFLKSIEGNRMMKYMIKYDPSLTYQDMINLKTEIDKRIDGIRDEEIKNLEAERERLDAQIQAMRGE